MAAILGGIGAQNRRADIIDSLKRTKQPSV
jgi:hypothetical protein